MILPSEHMPGSVRMNSPLISCIVPVFNGERYLSEALDSIFAQSYQPLEVIVVNDGSTDGTARVLAGYKHRLLYLEQRTKDPPYPGISE